MPPGIGFFVCREKPKLIYGRRRNAFLRVKIIFCFQSKYAAARRGSKRV